MRDRLLRGVALGEVVAFQHARHGVLGRQPDHVGRGHLAEPLGIESQFGALAVQHLVDLLGIGLGIGEHVFAGERLARGVLARGIADHAGEIADQEDHLVAQVLKLAHLVEQHRMADVQIRRRRVETGLDAQRPTRFQPLHQFFALDDFVRATRNRGQRLFQLAHAFFLVRRVCGRSCPDRYREVDVNCALIKNVDANP